ncbi:hypothetical protein PC123_g17293 [Phytophthora cactorum]|nr:hypothetical protein PC123_g17293 [Phytophthora cactorum]
MAKVCCGVYGKGTVFSVDLESNADVEALQKVIVNEKKNVNDRFNVDPSSLTLYLARKEGEETKCLSGGQNVEDLLGGDIDATYQKMFSWWKLNKKELFGSDFTPGEEEIHVLVELPKAAVGVGPMMRAVFWLVTGSVVNVLHTRGARSRLCRIADSELGYYDPTNVFSDNKVQAFWYAKNDLQIHVFFSRKSTCIILPESLER